jgi:hypothetical protein
MLQTKRKRIGKVNILFIITFADVDESNFVFSGLKFDWEKLFSTKRSRLHRCRSQENAVHGNEWVREKAVRPASLSREARRTWKARWVFNGSPRKMKKEVALLHETVLTLNEESFLSTMEITFFQFETALLYCVYNVNMIFYCPSVSVFSSTDSLVWFSLLVVDFWRGKVDSKAYGSKW